MAKPMLVTLPCVLLLLDVWPLGRTVWGPGPVTPAARKTETVAWLLWEKTPLFLLVATSSVVTYLVQRGGGSVSSALTLDERLANAVVAVARYLGKFFVPVDLAVLYPHPGHWAAGTVAVTLVALAAMVAGLVTRPAVSAAMTVTLAVGEKEVPSAPMVAASETVPGLSATKVTVALRGSPMMRPPAMLHW